jgi:hypothetical protein
VDAEKVSRVRNRNVVPRPERVVVDGMVLAPICGGLPFGCVAFIGLRGNRLLLKVENRFWPFPQLPSFMALFSERIFVTGY